MKHHNATGLELAGVYGPFSAQGEYITNSVSRKAGYSNLRFDGFYTTVSYFLTGESRAYSFPSGSFGDISKINNSRYGAWQVLARYSNLNLNRKTVRGGHERDFTVGLNWYINNHVEMKFNYIRALAHRAYDGTIGTPTFMLLEYK